MKHLKLFEGKVDEVYVIVLMQGGMPEGINIYYDEESAENVLINTIHDMAKEEEGENYGCKDIFDVSELLEYWNYGENGPRLYEKSNEIYYFQINAENRKIELVPELKMRKDAKKYNL